MTVGYLAIWGVRSGLGQVISADNWQFGSLRWYLLYPFLPETRATVIGLP